MSRKNRSLLLFSLVPAVLLGSVFAVAQAADATKWSDPASWPNRKVPAAGDKVTIGKDKEVVLDVSPPALGGLSIDGKLTFADTADLELTTEWIMLHGELAIGSEAKPHTRKATITLTDNVKGEDVMAGMGDRGIMLSGGTLNLHGTTTNTWTKLASHGRRRRHLHPGAECLGLEGGRRNHPRLHGLRSASGRASHHHRDQRQQRSRSTRSSTSCTSARSRSTWISAVRLVCSRAT